MIEGALILLTGIIIGAAATLGAVFYLPKSKPRQRKGLYDKYRNPEGLLSRKAVNKEGG